MHALSVSFRISSSDTLELYGPISEDVNKLQYASVTLTAWWRFSIDRRQSFLLNPASYVPSETRIIVIVVIIQRSLFQLLKTNDAGRETGGHQTACFAFSLTECSDVCLGSFLDLYLGRASGSVVEGEEGERCRLLND